MLVYNKQTGEEVNLGSKVSARRLIQRAGDIWSFEKPVIEEDITEVKVPKKKSAKKGK